MPISCAVLYAKNFCEVAICVENKNNTEIEGKEPDAEGGLNEKKK